MKTKLLSLILALTPVIASAVEPPVLYAIKCLTAKVESFDNTAEPYLKVVMHSRGENFETGLPIEAGDWIPLEDGARIWFKTEIIEHNTIDDWILPAWGWYPQITDPDFPHEEPPGEDLADMWATEDVHPGTAIPILDATPNRTDPYHHFTCVIGDFKIKHRYWHLMDHDTRILTMTFDVLCATDGWGIGNNFTLKHRHQWSFQVLPEPQT